jgi:DNA-binding beta-propeller fold protein YncE
VFVGDTGNDRVQVFDAEGRFLYAFGESGDGPGQFLRPMDLDVDRDGRVFVADFGGDRIQVFTPRGQLVRTIRGEQSSAGSFDGAAGVLVAPDGDVYVADFYHHRVVRFHSSDGHTSILGRPGRILPGRLNYPTDLAWAGGQLLVADAYNNRVQVLSPEGDPVTRWGGPLGLGAPGSWGGWFRVATGIATDSRERVYVADFENHRIQVFDATGHLLTLFGSQGSGPGEFERPTDLDVGADGRIYVVDFGNDRIQVFSPFGDDDP